MNRHVLIRILVGVLVPAIVFTGFATLIENAVEIQVLNSVRLAMATGVLVAYLPPVVQIVLDPRPLQRSDFLSFGIVYSWMAAVGSGLWWVTFQLMGRPPSMSNNDFVALTIFLSCLAALFHLAAPGALDQRIPPLRWVIIGALVATGMLGALLVFDAADIRMRVEGFFMHDRQPPPG